MIVVATTIAPYKVDGYETVWLSHAEEMRAQAEDDVTFFAALEVDGRGRDVYGHLVQRLADLGGETWSFALDDGEETVTGNNRFVRICTGRNLCQEFALRIGASHLLFLDSDIEPQPDAIPRLVELKHPVTGGHVPTYCLDGPPVHRWLRRDVREHWNTAGFLMLERQVFRTVAWHWDPDDGLTDDPAFQRETKKLFGPTWVAHDVIGIHHPATIGPVQDRGHDLARVPW